MHIETYDTSDRKAVRLENGMYSTKVAVARALAKDAATDF